MKIEKLDENKIKITFDYNDLKEHNIDFHSFMTNSTQAKALLLKILEQAEENLNFKTDHYKLEFNTIALTNGIFILTITRSEPNIKIKKASEKIHIRRKSNSLHPTFSIYKFSCFDNYIEFINFLKNRTDCLFMEIFSQNVSLYKNNCLYYLTISTNLMNDKQKEFLFSTITEFASFISNSYLFLAKIREYSIYISNKSF